MMNWFKYIGFYVIKLFKLMPDILYDNDSIKLIRYFFLSGMGRIHTAGLPCGEKSLVVLWVRRKPVSTKFCKNLGSTKFYNV